MSDKWDNALSIWTVYDKRKDYPDLFVARRFEVCPNESRATKDAVFSSTLEKLQEHMRMLGLTAIGRYPHDDPNIVEVWL